MPPRKAESDQSTKPDENPKADDKKKLDFLLVCIRECSEFKPDWKAVESFFEMAPNTAEKQLGNWRKGFRSETAKKLVRENKDKEKVGRKKDPRLGDVEEEVESDVSVKVEKKDKVVVVGGKGAKAEKAGKKEKVTKKKKKKVVEKAPEMSEEDSTEVKEEALASDKEDEEVKESEQETESDKE